MKKLHIKGTVLSKEVSVTSLDGLHTILVGFRVNGVRENLRQGVAYTELDALSDTLKQEELLDKQDTLFKDEFLYLKNVVVTTEDETSIVIQDTRVEEASEGLWETTAECLSLLLDVLLDDVNWRVAIYTSYTNKQANSVESLEEAEVKN